MSVVLAIAIVLAIIYAVPFVVYGIASALGGVKLPEGASPAQFLIGVLITKLGTAIAFVLLFWVGGDAWADRWLLYGMIWFAVFAASEIGEAVSGRTSMQEAALGILSEAIYAPASAFVVHTLLG